MSDKKKDIDASKLAADMVAAEAGVQPIDNVFRVIEWGGLKLRVRADAAQDMRVIQAISALQQGTEPNPARPLEILLGVRQFGEVMGACTDTSGDPDGPGYGFVRFRDENDDEAGVLGCFRVIMKTLDPTTELPA